MLQIRSSGSVQIKSVKYKALLERLQEIAEVIRREKPGIKKILLFGSFAKKNYTPESDVDVLIVIRQCDVPFLARRDIFEPFFEGIPFDVNVLVYTDGEIERLMSRNNAFIREVLENSVVL